MKIDAPAVLDILRRTMVARIATISRNGRPSINPLYFVVVNGHIWLGTVDWTLAARNVKADPRVSVLFEVERSKLDHRLLRVTGHASVRTEPEIKHAYNLRAARKYILTPGGIFHYLAHIQLLPLMNRYHAQSVEKGAACVIEVIPEQAEFLNDGQPR